ncbi:MAG: UDP-N-acetylmuramoyl-L-alanyl-D-glutamate--2,6-diaminopimelate ligase [Candidatus Melainabacteria bacterium]|nr:UDP-N-acetylmuramoyl-L-alanyl-D-glutamate--2,6-diaminopimelate ligase [Candidatus Melainabacteria bacterium]
MNLVKDISNYSSITCNSKEVQAASIFVCIKGTHADGHKYIEQAASAGASLIVISNEFAKAEGVFLDTIKKNYPQVEFLFSDDTRVSLAELAAKLFNEPSKHIDVYGVTGTNGKTTVTHLIQEIFDDEGCALLGTIGVRYKSTDKYIELGNTTPQSNLIQEELSKAYARNLRKLTMEVSSHALDQKRCHGIEFKYSIVTNLTQDHLDYHHNMEEYLMAKAEIFKQTKYAAILNPDNEYFSRFKEEALRAKLDIWTFAINTNADIRAVDVKISQTGLEYGLEMSDRLKAKYLAEQNQESDKAKADLDLFLKKSRIQLKLNGTFNIYNSLAAFLLALLEGISLESLLEKAPTLRAVPGRFETITAESKPLCIVDYAHSPDGLENILKGARDLISNSEFTRLVCVFGCGGDRDITKRPKMGRIAYDLADLVYVTSDNPRSEEPRQIIADILAGIPNLEKIEIIENRADAIKRAVSAALVTDVVVVAGKGHEDYQILKDQTIHFDDREHVRKALAI